LYALVLGGTTKNDKNKEEWEERKEQLGSWKAKRHTHTHTHTFYVRQPLCSHHWLGRLFQL